MASSARVTSSLTADQSIKWTAADNASLSVQQPQPIETIVLLSPSPATPFRGMPAVHIDLTGSPEARQPPVHHGAANRPCLSRRKHKSISSPAQRQRRNGIVSIGDSQLHHSLQHRDFNLGPAPGSNVPGLAVLSLFRYY